MHRFTSEFGMGSGGSNALLPPGKLLRSPQCGKPAFGSIDQALGIQLRCTQNLWVLYGQASRAISTG